MVSWSMLSAEPGLSELSELSELCRSLSEVCRRLCRRTVVGVCRSLCRTLSGLSEHLGQYLSLHYVNAIGFGAVFPSTVLPLLGVAMATTPAAAAP